MEQDAKIKIGSILLIVGILTFFVQFLVRVQTMGLMISIVMTFVGYGFLLKGLSYRNRGLAFIISGLCVIVPLIVYISITNNAAIPWTDLLITILFDSLFLCSQDSCLRY